MAWYDAGATSSKPRQGRERGERRGRQTTPGQRSTPGVSTLLTTGPEKYRKPVDLYDKEQDVALRARSYLHSNCAQCHVEAGGGNAQMKLWMNSGSTWNDAAA
jgi:mono/diheme cytochrome c family protein